MPSRSLSIPYVCARCLRANGRQHAASITRLPSRAFSLHSPHLGGQAVARKPSDEVEPLEHEERKDEIKEQGAMSRRLQEATEDALFEGGRAGRKAVEDAGFSEELRAKLLEKVESAKFKSDNASAFAEAGLSSAVGQGTRDIAAAQAWSGSENTEDTVLRMLNDAHKPLKPGARGAAKIPSPIVDLRLKPAAKPSSGQRLADARDKTSIYSISKDENLSEKEKEAIRKELKERFTPGARAMPNTISGLAALANERIEDAIARGQFKNIPRGKGVVRDTRADNPFIDTTEYIMNKMIQRQDIVPPWIEKQQELVKAARIFRARLRNDWKRQAARTIASKGGSLLEQMRTAELYALAEAKNNPQTRSVESISIPTNITDDPVMISITQEPSTIANPTPEVKVTVETQGNEVTISEPVAETLSAAETSFITKSIATSPEVSTETPLDASAETSTPTSSTIAPGTPLPAPFRIPAWEASERSYLTLSITNLNNLTRTYNLMAPDIAKKPYFHLDRELRSCYADVAPHVAEAIKERAQRPAKDLVEKIPHTPGSILTRFGGERARIYDTKRPNYGFKEFWKDLFAKEEKSY